MSRALTATLPANPINRLALVLIDGYRRWISPRKGYACPHRLLHGGDSCSAIAQRFYLTLGPIDATRATLARLWSCQEAGTTLARSNAAGSDGTRRRVHRGQCCIVLPLPTCGGSTVRRV